MSYSHTQRRKTTKRFKKKFGEHWYRPFVGYVCKIVAERLGPPIGTLEDIINTRRGGLINGV
jgi:hypothetical protein